MLKGDVYYNKILYKREKCNFINLSNYFYIRINNIIIIICFIIFIFSNNSFVKLSSLFNIRIFNYRYIYFLTNIFTL